MPRPTFLVLAFARIIKGGAYRQRGQISNIATFNIISIDYYMFIPVKYLLNFFNLYIYRISFSYSNLK